MSLVMVPACAKAADGAAPTQQNIKTKAAGSLARELVIHRPPFFRFARWVLARFERFASPQWTWVRLRTAMVKPPKFYAWRCGKEGRRPKPMCDQESLAIGHRAIGDHEVRRRLGDHNLVADKLDVDVPNRAFHDRLDIMLKAKRSP